MLLCGSLLLGSAQIAQAAHNNQPTFREFHASRSDLDRHDAHKLFHATYNGRSTGGATLPPPINPKSSDGGDTANWHHIIWCGDVPQPTTNRAAKLLNVGTQNIGSSVVRLNRGVDLDLSSADQNIVLGANLFKDTSSIEITVGSGKQTFSAGSKATAAEYIAIKQALNSNSGQKLVVNQNGIASGGSVDLTQITDNNDPLRASSLTVASGVTTYGDFGKRSDFRLTGDLNNYGTVVALSSDRTVRSGAIRADDITNNAGATITSVVPDSLSASHLARSVDLTLDARGDLTNLGTISSSGDLTLSAGNAVNNSGTVTANNSVNIAAPNINNSGTISAVTGNINLNGPTTSALIVNNTGGTLSALQGAINVRTPDYTGTFDNTISGGDLLSKEVNINGGNATNYVDVRQLTGVLSQTGLASHVLASTDNLIIGSTCLTGDPTFFNFGDITISSLLSTSETLTVIATGSIFSSTGATIEARTATHGLDINLIAGANITSPASGGGSTIPVGGAISAVTIDGTGSATGGNISLGTGTIINTSPTNGGTGAGGNVSMFAFQDAGGTLLGRVNIANASIITGGVGTAANGNISIIAGGNNSGSTAIQVGAMDTTGGTGIGGYLTIVTAQPVASAGPVTYGVDGIQTSASSLQASSTINTNGSIKQTGGLAKIAGNVTFTAGKDITQNSTVTDSSLFTDNINSIVTLTAGGNIIGADISSPFVIEGFNGKINNKFLKTHGGSAGNNLLTVTAGGKALINRLASTDLNLQASSADQEFVLRTNSKLTIAGNVTSTNQKVQLENTGGALVVNPNVSITAFNDLELTNGTKKKPTLTLGANSQLTTTAIGGPASGDIFVTVDPKVFSLKAAGIKSSGGRLIPPPTVAGGPTYLLENEDDNTTLDVNGTTPEKALGAGQPITFQGPPVNTVTSNNATILIENSGKKGAISFGGGVQVTAGQ